MRVRVGLFALLPLLAACTVQARALTAEWPAMPAPVVWQPEAEACHLGSPVSMNSAQYGQVPCSEKHEYQTVYVGEFTTSEAAWADCDTRLTTFVGGQWRDRKLRLRVAVPSEAAREGGASWYSCEAAAFLDIDWRIVTSTDTFQGGFNRLEALRFGCFYLPTGDFDLTSKRCDEPHNTEFVGHIKLDMTFEEMEAEAAGEDKDDQLHLLCQALIDAYVGAPKLYSGTWVWRPIRQVWETGDHSARCLLWLEDTNVSKSLKGVGAKGWPIR